MSGFGRWCGRGLPSPTLRCRFRERSSQGCSLLQAGEQRTGGCAGIADKAVRAPSLARVFTCACARFKMSKNGAILPVEPGLLSRGRFPRGELTALLLILYTVSTGFCKKNCCRGIGHGHVYGAASTEEPLPNSRPISLRESGREVGSCSYLSAVNITLLLNVSATATGIAIWFSHSSRLAAGRK
jgi:hypothetical protein